MQGARPIYIYRLAPCTENCSQRIYKTFSIKYLEHVHIFSTFEPKKHKSVFQAAVSTCTLKILCCGYNLATQKRRKFIKNYDTRRYKKYSFSSLSANKGVNQQVTRFTPFITPKYSITKKMLHLNEVELSVSRFIILCLMNCCHALASVSPFCRNRFQVVPFLFGDRY